MKKIPLTQGKFALVDDEDYDYLMQWKWHAVRDRNDHWYAKSWIAGKRIRMHRVIMRVEKGLLIDHINGNGLDNRKCNLRICTHAQNMRNQKSRRRNTSSKYKGVSWHPYNKKWQAAIEYNRKRIHLGLFIDEEKAARAYDKAAVELFGEFAKTNFPRRIPHERAIYYKKNLIRHFTPY